MDVCVHIAQDLFEDIDTDGSGGVSLEELTAGLTRLGYKLTPNEIEQLVSQSDVNVQRGAGSPC